MLFGLGFALQLERSTRSGRNLIPVYRRRLTILLFIGFAHAIFIYGGDILHTYALLGFALLPFRNRSDRFILGCALAIGLAGNALSVLYFWLPDDAVHFLADPLATRLASVVVECGIPALALAYVCILVLLYQRPTGRRFLSGLAPLGRMALTNYLLQSVICVFVFYGVGFGLVGRIGIAAATALAITTFLLQIAISGWWLERFRFGPAEWAWRCLSYGQWMPIR